MKSTSLAEMKINSLNSLVMIKYLIWPWLLFFLVMGFSMMPSTMMLIMVISFIGGVLDALTRNKKKKKIRKWRKKNDAVNDFSPIW